MDVDGSWPPGVTRSQTFSVNESGQCLIIAQRNTYYSHAALIFEPCLWLMQCMKRCLVEPTSVYDYINRTWSIAGRVQHGTALCCKRSNAISVGRAPDQFNRDIVSHLIAGFGSCLEPGIRCKRGRAMARASESMAAANAFPPVEHEVNVEGTGEERPIASTSPCAKPGVTCHHVCAFLRRQLPNVYPFHEPNILSHLQIMERTCFGGAHQDMKQHLLDSLSKCGMSRSLSNHF